MNPARFSQMMKYLTRAKKANPELPDVFPASKAPIPSVREDVAQVEAINRFVKANPRQDMAGGGRIGFFKAGMVKQGVNEGKASIPYFNDGKTAYFKDLETAEKAIADRKDKTSRFKKARTILNDPKLKKEFIKYGNQKDVSIKDIRKKFNISMEEFYDGGLRNLFDKDFQLQQAKKIKPKTINNINTLLNDKQASNFLKKGQIIPDEIITKLKLAPSEAATATVRIGQIYGGNDFGVDEFKKIRKNVKASDKLFDTMNKFKFGNPYRSKLYRTSLELIDQQLGNEKGTFESLKKKASYILKKNKIKGFDINEIAGVTGTARTGVGEFSQFVDIMDSNLNQKQMASFQSAFSQARQNIMNDPNVFAKESKRINRLAGIFEKEYGVELPRIRALNEVEKFYSPTRLKQLSDQGLDIKAASQKLGYTVQMPKGALTAQEFISGTPKANKQISANLRKLGFKCKFAASSGGVGSCDDPMSYVDDIKKQEDLLKVQNSKAPQAAKTLNTARKINAVRSLFTQTLGPGALAFEAAAALPIAYMGYKGGKTPVNILGDSTYGLLGKSDQRILLDKAIELGYDTSNIKNVQNFFKKAGEFDKQAARADEFMGPDDMFMYPQMVQKAEKDLFSATQKFLTPTGEQIPERVAAFNQLPLVEQAVAKDQANLAAKRQEQIGGFLQSPITDYLPGLAGGGIAKMAGVSSGPPPESGPNSQGLQGLMKRVRNR